MKNSIDIADLQAGDHKAYEKLFVEWYPPLCNYANSILRDEDEAKDIVQKMFYKLWDQRSELEIHTSVKSYLYRIVHNDCINKVKQLKVREEHHQYLAYVNHNQINDTEEPLRRSELERQIELAIESLPPRCGEVFKLSRFKQLSCSEIAEELNITTNTVETQIVKALKILRKELKDYLPFLLLFSIQIF